MPFQILIGWFKQAWNALIFSYVNYKKAAILSLGDQKALCTSNN
jgi:hypothetical protein